VRLFVALEIPSAVRENLAALIKRLRGADSPASKSKVRWVRPENIHVTLKFIGHVNAAKLEPIHAALAEVRSNVPVDLQFRGLGFFPSQKRPRVFWAGMEMSPNLPALAKDIDARMEKFGVPRETREFTPHLTLARFEPPGISEKLLLAIQENSAEGFGALHTREFHLIESKLKLTGAEYTTLRSFSFQEA
jgi:RNA 2',3'-cyclic 3'-phosphodiesterase